MNIFCGTHLPHLGAKVHATRASDTLQRCGQAGCIPGTMEHPVQELRLLEQTLVRLVEQAASVGITCGCAQSVYNVNTFACEAA